MQGRWYQSGKSPAVIVGGEGITYFYYVCQRKLWNAIVLVEQDTLGVT